MTGEWICFFFGLSDRSILVDGQLLVILSLSVELINRDFEMVGFFVFVMRSFQIEML